LFFLFLKMISGVCGVEGKRESEGGGGGGGGGGASESLT